MIASVFGSIASAHRFRCSEALLPMVGCRHTQHCFQKAMAWTNQYFPKPCQIPWDLTKSCEPTHDTATEITARNR